MAIQITNITKLKDNIYTVSVQDTGVQLGTDADNNPTYKTYSVKYNSNTSASDLIEKFENVIKEYKTEEDSKTSIETSIKTAVESIDTSKIVSKEG